MRFFVWRWGTRKPSPAILTERELDEHDRGKRLTLPIMLSPEEEDWTLDQLASKYPPPANQEYPDHVSKPKKSVD